MNILVDLSPLEQEAIPHPAVSDSTHKLFGVEVMRKAEFDPTCFVQGLQVLRGKLKIETGEIVLQLRELSRTDNRYDWYRPIT
jgi:glutamine cyclotransferase